MVPSDDPTLSFAYSKNTKGKRATQRTKKKTLDVATKVCGGKCQGVIQKRGTGRRSTLIGRTQNHKQHVPPTSPLAKGELEHATLGQGDASIGS